MQKHLQTLSVKTPVPNRSTEIVITKTQRNQVKTIKILSSIQVETNVKL